MFITFADVASSNPSWAIKTSSQSAFSKSAAAVFNGKIYMAGGLDQYGTPLDTLDEYDPMTGSWSHKAPMSTKRAGASMVVFNNRLYVIGGSSDNQNGLTSIEEYDPELDSWSYIGELLQERWNSGAVVIKVLFISIDPPC